MSCKRLCFGIVFLTWFLNESRPGCQLCDDGLPHGCDSWFKVDHFEFQQHINVELVLTVWETGVLVSKKHT